MITKIKCECGVMFRGWDSKEDTCPKCLKKLIKSEKRYKLVTQGNIKIILTESELIRAILRK